MHAELYRAQQWRRVTVASVVAVALLAILMLGMVAFKAIDASADRETGAAGDQLMERVVFSQ